MAETRVPARMKLVTIAELELMKERRDALLAALKEAEVYLEDGAALTALTIIEEAIEAAS